VSELVGDIGPGNEMNESEITQELRRFFVDEVLHGKGNDFMDDTPLLELGLLNSLEMVKLLTFLDERFGVQVPLDRVEAESLRDIRAITSLVKELLNSAE
jgi:acyl carrier protein